MPQIIEMPKLSDDMTVGTIGRWLKREGDIVQAGEALADVETDKATLELESPFDGILLKRFVEEGGKVLVDSPVCAIGHPDEKVEATAAMPPESPAQSAPKIPQSPGPARPATPLNLDAKSAPVENNLAARTAPLVCLPSAEASNQRLRISPLARKLAKAKGINPATIAGSGPRGRILRMDILAADKNLPAGEVAKPLIPTAARPVPGVVDRASDPTVQPSDRVVPNSPMRSAIARRLLESKTEIPHFYLEVEVDAAPMLALRSQLNAALDGEGIKISVNDFMLKASAFALLKAPEVNSSWEGTSIRIHQHAHVSFAVAIDDGLITPVVRDTGWKSLAAVSLETRALAARAKEKKLTPVEYTGGTFCVTNLGMMGITRFSAIINPPNSAILAVGATVRKPVVQDDQIVIGERLTLTLSCDHRVVDGILGARFLNEVRGFLEAPVRLLCDPPAK